MRAVVGPVEPHAIGAAEGGPAGDVAFLSLEVLEAAGQARAGQVAPGAGVVTAVVRSKVAGGPASFPEQGIGLLVAQNLRCEAVGIGARLLLGRSDQVDLAVCLLLAQAAVK